MEEPAGVLMVLDACWEACREKLYVDSDLVSYEKSAGIRRSEGSSTRSIPLCLTSLVLWSAFPKVRVWQ